MFLTIFKKFQISFEFRIWFPCIFGFSIPLPAYSHAQVGTFITFVVIFGTIQRKNVFDNKFLGGLECDLIRIYYIGIIPERYYLCDMYIIISSSDCILYSNTTTTYLYDSIRSSIVWGQFIRS